MNLVTLLIHQNNCLEKIKGISSDFLSLCHQKLAIDELNNYEKQRTHLFRGLEIYDRNIQLQLKTEVLVESSIKKIQSELKKQKELKSSINLLSQNIIDLLQNELSKIEQETSFSNRILHSISKFKCFRSEPGEQLDGRA